jgi:hypothetical protein
MASVIWIWVRLKPSVYDNDRTIDIHTIFALCMPGPMLGSAAARKLCSDITHERLCPGVDVFGIVFIEYLFVNHRGIFGLLRKTRLQC